MEQFVKTKALNKKILDECTGEILDLVITKKVTQEQFIMVFFHSLLDEKMMSLTGNQLKLLYICWRTCSISEDSEEGNIVCNTPYFKDLVRKNGLNLSNATINIEMCKLAKKEFLISKGFSTYMLNPEYFFRGRLSDRTKLVLNICSDKLKK